MSPSQSWDVSLAGIHTVLSQISEKIQNKKLWIKIWKIFKGSLSQLKDCKIRKQQRQVWLQEQRSSSLFIFSTGVVNSAVIMRLLINIFCFCQFDLFVRIEFSVVVTIYLFIGYEQQKFVKSYYKICFE